MLGMSSVGRAASRGSKSGKAEHTNATAKAQKTDTKTETVKTMENSKAQVSVFNTFFGSSKLSFQNANQPCFNLQEQMRIAQIIGDKEDPQLKEKIKQVRFLHIFVGIPLRSTLALF